MKLFGKKFTVLIMALVMALTAVFSVACDGDDDNGDKGGDITYTVTLERSGGDPFTDTLVVVLGTNYVGRTDSEGKWSFTAPKKTYDLMVDVPEGYVQTGYTLTAKKPNQKFSLEAKLIDTPAAASLKYELGSVMHDFSFTDTRGRTMSLSQIFETKKAVLINFWYISCSYCVYEFPDMQTAYEEYKDDLEIIAINAGPYPEDKDDAQIEAFRTNQSKGYGWDELTFPMVRHTDSSEALGINFGVVGCPTTVLIDREGVVCFYAAGPGGLDEFRELFETYTADDYTQVIQYPDNGELELPDVKAPSSARIAEAINGEGFTADYYPDYGEYNWPWIIGEDGKSITASNKGKRASYSMLNADFEIAADQVLAFDYKVSTEEDADLFGVFVDGTLIHTYSGVTPDYTTCYAYVPLKAGKHTLTLAYTKDATTNAHEDSVSVKNIRFEESVGSRTEILYRCATGGLNADGEYKEYVKTYYNEADGYYHVGTKDGPLVIADLLNPIKWESSAWDMVEMAQNLMYDSDGDGTAEDHRPALELYARIANNATRKGFTAVTKDLKNALDALNSKFGTNTSNANEWLDMCYYYIVYGGTEGEIVQDPSIGLAIHNAYPVTITAAGQELVKNHVNKYRILMPRGIYYEILPEKTAVYRMRTVGDVASQAWLYGADGRLIGENGNNATGDINDGNFSMSLLLEAGKAYYLALDFQNIDDTGEFDFVVEELGESGTVWTVAATGPYSFPVNAEGEMIGDYYVVGAVDYIVGDDNCYHVKNSDGSVGPKLYINMLGPTNLFPDHSVKNLLNKSANYVGGYYCKNCGLKYAASVKDFEEAEQVICWCGNTNKKRFEVKKSFELPTALEDNTGRVMTMMFTMDDGSGYPMVQYVPFYDLNTDEDFNTNTKYTELLMQYGIKFIDYTDIVEGYVNDANDIANAPFDANELGGNNGEPYEGYIPASKELIDIIQKFIVFGDYSMSPQIKNAWLMMCCYFKPLGM